MIFGPASRRMPLESWANVWITLANVQRSLVAPAAAVATVTGLGLTMAMAKGGLPGGPAMWLIVMQALGLVAAILTLAFATPMTNRMAVLARRSLEKGVMDPTAARVNKVLSIIGSLSGAIMLVALYFGVAKP